MSRKAHAVMFLFIALSAMEVRSSDWLRVQDPQSPWRSGTGTIEEAVVTIRPRGLYMEYGLYLTFSARGLNFGNSDTLEVQFYFDLPEDAIVHDSWLWIGDEIIKAKILDKWTAAAIFEEIVDRRRDPSILFKRSRRQYELRIFPMAGDESRKVKITYLSPTRWSPQHVNSSLPTNLLRTSKNKLSKFHILTWLDESWKTPTIIEFPDIPFQSRFDDTFGAYLQAEVPSEATQSGLNFRVEAPLEDGIYLNKLGDSNEGIYQMALLPSEALDLSSNRKAVLLFDYDASNSDVPPSEIISTVQSLLISEFAQADSFNLIFSQLNISRASETWLPADSTTIANTFASLGEEPLASFSNLPSLLANAIDFVKNNGNDGSLLLISNSDQVGNSQVANPLLDDLMELMETPLPIHVADFQSRNRRSHNIGGRNYRGNEYFYTNITRLTTANFFSILSGNSFSQVVESAVQSLSGFIASFDLHTTMENGFCYSRFNLGASDGTTYLNRPILQVGKYSGDFPFVIDVSGVFESTTFSQQVKRSESTISTTDSLAEEVWVGNFIKSLESQNQTNEVVNEIIDNSIEHRVLSIYSAFLALEPDRGGEVCYDCLDETVLVSVDDELTDSAEDDSTLIAYPNPFNAQTTIKFRVPDAIKPGEVNFRIYNIMGQVVRTFRNAAVPGQRSFQFVWDGRNDGGSSVASGNYFFIISAPKKQYALKILMMK